MPLYVHPGKQLRLSDRPALRSVVEARSEAAVLADAARAVADASRVIDAIDRTLAACRRRQDDEELPPTVAADLARYGEARAAAVADRPPPNVPIEYGPVGRVLSVK